MIAGEISLVSAPRIVLLGTLGILAACNGQAETRAEGERTASPEGNGAVSVRDLALTKGVYAYVEHRHAAPSCPPPLATVATFDGAGFGSRNSTDCRFEPTQRDGSVWSGTQTCTDTYSEVRRTEPWTVTVEGSTQYTLSSSFRPSTYKLCPGEHLSEWVG
jgi:hypothetical protein